MRRTKQVALIACATMQEEIEQIIRERQLSFVYLSFIPSGLHNTTERLRECVQGELDKLSSGQWTVGEEAGVTLKRPIDRVLLCFGLCGNVIEGLKNGPYETWLPRCDDCISFLLGGKERRQKLDQKSRGYYLTKGWLKGEANLHREYRQALAQYGQEMADEIFQEILGDYRSLYLLDTKPKEWESFLREGRTIAEDFKLKEEVIEGDLSWMERYLEQKLDKLLEEKKVVCYKAGETMRFLDFL